MQVRWGGETEEERKVVTTCDRVSRGFGLVLSQFSHTLPLFKIGFRRPEGAPCAAFGRVLLVRRRHCVHAPLQRQGRCASPGGDGLRPPLTPEPLRAKGTALRAGRGPAREGAPTPHQEQKTRVRCGPARRDNRMCPAGSSGSGHAKAPADWDSAGAFLLVRDRFGYSSSAPR